MTDLTLPPSRREWAKACEDRAAAERKAAERAWSPPDENGQEWKNVLLQVNEGHRCVAIPEGASAVVFVYLKPKEGELLS